MHCDGLKSLLVQLPERIWGRNKRIPGLTCLPWIPRQPLRFVSPRGLRERIYVCCYVSEILEN